MPGSLAEEQHVPSSSSTTTAARTTAADTPDDARVWVDKNNHNNNNDDDDDDDANDNHHPTAGMLVSSDQQHITTRECRDEDRWMASMPSLRPFSPTLQVLDLFDCRYITALDESLTHLTQLVRLHISRCWALETLPADWSRMQALQEVSVACMYF